MRPGREGSIERAWGLSLKGVMVAMKPGKEDSIERTWVLMMNLSKLGEVAMTRREDRATIDRQNAREADRERKTLPP